MIPENKYVCSKEWKFATAILRCEKVILSWKGVIFSGEKAILSSFPYYQIQQHLETGVYYIQVGAETILESMQDRFLIDLRISVHDDND